MKRSSKRGFTLAEVLVTLAVVGIVAAMSIPSLLNNTSGSEYKAGLKKAVATLNQAVQMKIARDGTYPSSVGTASALADFFVAELNVIKDSDTTIYTADGIKYTFAWTAACTDVAADQKCKVTVDVNGDKGPGTDSDTAKDFKDIYTLTITTSSVIPSDDDDAAAIVLMDGASSAINP